MRIFSVTDLYYCAVTVLVQSSSSIPQLFKTGPAHAQGTPHHTQQQLANKWGETTRHETAHVPNAWKRGYVAVPTHHHTSTLSVTGQVAQQVTSPCYLPNHSTHPSSLDPHSSPQAYRGAGSSPSSLRPASLILFTSLCTLAASHFLSL